MHFGPGFCQVNLFGYSPPGLPSRTISRTVSSELLDFVFLFTHSDRHGVDISVTVCFCLFVRLRIFSGEDKASGVKFCTVVYGRPGQGISHFGELCAPRSPKSDESATHPKVKFRVERASVIACISLSCGVWIYGRPRRRAYMSLFFRFCAVRMDNQAGHLVSF